MIDSQDTNEILDIVSRIEDRRFAWQQHADAMEEMWALRLWDGESDDNRTYVTSSTPRNAVDTARRMIDTLNVDVRCPAMGFDAQADEAQDMKERWLQAMWRNARVERKENVIGSAFWQALVLGRGVLQALWIRDVLPKARRDRQMPLLIRTLDPRMCGFEDGPLYTQYAFYKPTLTVGSIRQQFPMFDDPDAGEEEEKDVIDFWWIGHEDGKVYNAVLVDDEYVMPPTVTKYIDLPLVPFSGYYQPSAQEQDRHTSFLLPLKNPWEVTSDVMTMTATALMYHYFPTTAIINEFGSALNDEPLAPGEVRQFPAGTSFPNIFNTPNQGLANSLLSQAMQEVNESTFTGAARGMPLGSNQAGYSYNAAMAADESRIQEPRSNLQVALAGINELALGFVDRFGGQNGVVLQGQSDVEGGRYIVRLTPEMVASNYRNEVMLKPTTERDLASQVAMATRMVDSGIISRETMRDLFIPRELPRNEQQRIELERALQNPNTAAIVGLHTLQQYGSSNPAVRQVIDVLQMQTDAVIGQLQMQAQQLQQMQQQQASQQQMGQQSPAMMGGGLPAQAEGQLTPSTFAAAGNGPVTPEVAAEIARGAPPEGALTNG